MAVLRLIKESELKRRDVIGSGAFGTVYKVRAVRRAPAGITAISSTVDNAAKCCQQSNTSGNRCMKLCVFCF